MSFFEYSVPVNKSVEFGIRENKTEKEQPAYIDYNNRELWDAVVESNNRTDFRFIAVDNNIPYNDKIGNEKKRCDAMLYTEQTVIFIELKNQEKDWLNEAIGQLKSTIEHFKNEENIIEIDNLNDYNNNNFSIQDNNCKMIYKYYEIDEDNRPINDGIIVTKNIKDENNNNLTYNDFFKFIYHGTEDDFNSVKKKLIGILEIMKVNLIIILQFVDKLVYNLLIMLFQ